MLKVLELFCGAGSFSVNLDSLGIKHEIVGFSDIRESAIELFCKIHNKEPEENLGDINSISGKDLDVDLLVFGSPCQSFSRTGKSEGGTKGSKTKSSLMWESVRIMQECKPKWIVWENVPDAISKKHMINFQNYMDELSDMNYNTYYKVLYAYQLGSAQKRKRLFAVSVRKDIDNGEFTFTYDTKKPKKLIEYLEDEVSQSFNVEDKLKNELILEELEEGFKIKNATIQGYLIANNGDTVDTSFPKSETRRGRVQKEACATLLRSKGIAVVINNNLRYLTPKEYWRLQEMPENLWDKVDECNFTLNEMYDVVGGVINQKHLNVVFSSLANTFKWK